MSILNTLRIQCGVQGARGNFDQAARVFPIVYAILILYFMPVDMSFWT